MPKGKGKGKAAKPKLRRDSAAKGIMEEEQRLHDPEGLVMSHGAGDFPDRTGMIAKRYNASKDWKKGNLSNGISVDFAKPTVPSRAGRPVNAGDSDLSHCIMCQVFDGVTKKGGLVSQSPEP